MKDPIDPQKMHQDFINSVRKMMSQVPNEAGPETQPVREENEERNRSEKRKSILDFRLKPKDIKKHLDRFVIKQEQAKRVLATAVCDHYNHIKNCENTETCKHYNKQNILMLGPTGVGKTYLIRSLSELIGVPFTKADATKFSETGYVGGDVEDVVRDLVQRAEGDIRLAECGIIYLDEIDKIASASQFQGRDVSGAGVQRGLLKIMEDTDILLRNPQDVQSQIQALMEYQQKGKVSRPVINTRHILLIGSGSFSHLPPIIERRMKVSQIGFTETPSDKKDLNRLLHETETEDFIEYGFEPEFIGRLPIRVTCDPLNAEDLYQILTQSEGSILHQIKSSFEAYDIHCHFEDAALWEIAKRASKEKTGARALVTLLEKILRDIKYELPSSRTKDFKVTVQTVKDSKSSLSQLLAHEYVDKEKRVHEQIKEYEQRFEKQYGIKIEFDKKASQELSEVILREEKDPLSYLDCLLSHYPYGLGLIQKKKSQEKFVLTEKVISHPNEELESWIKNIYESSAAKS